MPPADEIMMPVASPEATSLAATHAMRQVADTLKVLSDSVTAQGRASTKALEHLADKVDGMNTRLIRLEEAKHGREIERLEGVARALESRINDLEGTRDQQRGAKGLIDWLRQFWPVAAAAGLGGLVGWFRGAA